MTKFFLYMSFWRLYRHRKGWRLRRHGKDFLPFEGAVSPFGSLLWLTGPTIGADEIMVLSYRKGWAMRTIGTRLIDRLP